MTAPPAAEFDRAQSHPSRDEPSPHDLTPMAPQGSRSPSARSFVGSLEEAALRHRAVNHPLLDTLSEGTREASHAVLREFALSYPDYAHRFPRYLSAVISRVEDQRHRTWLLENLQEESGNYGQEEIDALKAHGLRREWFDGIPHPKLFDRFTLAVGVEPEERAPVKEVVRWSELFLQILLEGPPAQAVGALGLGTELIVQAIYAPFTAAVERHPDISSRDGVFFALHSLVDEKHQAALRSIAVDMASSPQGRIDLDRGMIKSLNLRASYWDWLRNRALGPTMEGEHPRTWNHDEAPNRSTTSKLRSGHAAPDLC